MSSFLDEVLDRRDKELAKLDVEAWEKSGALGTPVYEGVPGGYHRGFDPLTGEADPSAEELLESSVGARERQQRMAMKYKGRGFPTVEGLGDVHGLVYFTDGKPPKYLSTGTKITKEQMGFAEGWAGEPPPGWDPVTGTIDPIEKAKFSDGKGSVALKDALRIQPTIITEEHADRWNTAHATAMAKLPAEVREEIASRESGVLTDKKWFHDLIKKNSGHLTAIETRILLAGRSYTAGESMEIIQQMALHYGPHGDPEGRGKSGQYKHALGSKWGPSEMGARRERLKDVRLFPSSEMSAKAEEYPYTKWYTHGEEGVIQGEQFFGAGKEWTTRGTIVRPSLPEWATGHNVRPAWFDNRYTGRLLGESTWDEGLAAWMLQVPGKLDNFIGKHLIEVRGLGGDERDFGFQVLPSMMWQLSTSWDNVQHGAADILGYLQHPNPESRSKVTSRWLSQVMHIPKDPSRRLDPSKGYKPIDRSGITGFLADSIDHFGPNFWELGHGMTIGLYGGVQKYVNPLSDQNVWSSNKSLHQGMMEFSEGANQMTIGMLNSVYRTIPGVDFENMMRYKPLEVFLNMTLARMPLAGAFRRASVGYVAAAELKIAQRAILVRENIAIMMDPLNKMGGIGKVGFAAGIGKPKGTFDLGRRLTEFSEEFNRKATQLADGASMDLQKSKGMIALADSLTIVSAPMSIFAPLEVLSIIVRRGTSAPGQGFIRQSLLAPLTKSSAGKVLALFQAVEREGLTHSRRSTLHTQQLAMDMMEISPDMMRKKLQSKEFAAYAEEAGLLEAYHSKPMAPGLGQVDDWVAARTGKAIETKHGIYERIDQSTIAKWYKPTVPKDFTTTFNEMAWMEHEPLFFNNPKRDLVRITESGVWELTPNGKRKLKLGINPKTKKPWAQNRVDADTLMMRNEVAGKLATMNMWGVDLARKSLQLSDEAIKLNLFHSPHQLRKMFWAQIYSPAALKAVSMEDIARRQRKGESRSVAGGATDSLLSNTLRKADIPIEARLVKVGEMIPDGIINKHHASAKEAIARADKYQNDAILNVEHLMDISVEFAKEYKKMSTRGFATQIYELADKLKRGESAFMKRIDDALKKANDNAADALKAGADEMAVARTLEEATEGISKIGKFYKSASINAHKSVSNRAFAAKRSTAVRDMKRRNKRDPVTGEPAPGGFGMTDDFFRTATTGLGKLSSMVEMHKIYRMAAKQRHIAKNYNPGKGWMMMPDEALYHGHYQKLNVDQLVAEAKRLGIPDEVINTAKGKSGAKANSALIKQIDAYSPKKYGDLSGKWVHEDVWFHIVNGQKFLDDMKHWYPKMISKWKSAHTSWSPTTTIRNVITNVMYFGPMAGLSILNPRNWKYLQQAIRDAFSNKKSRHWKETFEDGVFESSFMTAELGMKASDFVPMQAVWKTPLDGIKEFFGLVDKVHHGVGPKGWVKKRWHGGIDAAKFPGIFYSKVCDDVFRQAYHHKFKDRIGRSKAAAGAMEKFIDYKNVPGFVNLLRMPFAPYKSMATTSRVSVGPQHLRRKGPIPKQQPVGPVAATGLKALHFMGAQPFLSFTARAIPLTMEWLARSPVQAKVYLAIHDMMTAHSFAEAGVTPEGADALYGMTEGMNKWERFRYAPAASISALASLEGGEQQVPAFRGTELYPTGSAVEKRHLFVDTNFLNPFSFLAPGYDPIAGVSFLDYARNMGFANHFYITPIIDAIDKYQKDELGDIGAAELYSGFVQNYLSPAFPSATDIASVFGGGSHDAMTKRPGKTRLKGGRFWEKAASAYYGWVERDEYARSVTEKLLDLVAIKTKGYTQTRLVIGAAQDFLRHIDRITVEINKRYDVDASIRGIAEGKGKGKTDKALQASAEKISSGHLLAAERDLLQNYAAPSIIGLQRVLGRMPRTDARVDIQSRIHEFILDPTIVRLESLKKTIRAWMGQQTEYIKGQKMRRVSETPLDEREKELTDPKNMLEWERKFKQENK